MPSLHAFGWRQGSIIAAELAVTIHTADANGTATDRSVRHGSWMLVEQDCDLDLTDIQDDEKIFELRPVRAHEGDVPSAITGSRARIDNVRCLHALDVVARVTARWLMAHGQYREDTPEGRRREIKTWLGFRYDRPAVPNIFISTHGRLAELAKRGRQGFDLGRLRDIFVTYEEPTAKKTVANLYAIVEHAEDAPAALSWLVRIRDATGEDEPHIVRDIAAGSPDDVPMRLLEKGFSIYGDRHSLATSTT